jgi:cobalt-zinc-cadmium efflux system membrane fusion protein
MRLRGGFGAFVLFVLCAACSRSPDGEAREAEPPSEKVEMPDLSPANEGMVHLDPDALRDLRITTAAARLHGHAEDVEGLAETRVDEGAYAEVGSPIEARIVSLQAAPGARVEVGATLAHLQSVELGRARASVLGAKRKQEIAAETVERLRALVESRVAPQSEWLAAQSALATAEAESRAAEASLHALGVPMGETSDPADLSRFPLLAPIGGTILERAAVLGQAASPDRFLFRISDLSRIWLVIQVFERDAARLAEGAPVRARFVAYPEREFEGRLEFLGTEVNPESRVVSVRAVLENEEGLLRPGMTATAWISLGEEVEVLTVPAGAIQRIEDDWCAFVPVAPGRFEVRSVARGRDLSGEVEILSGLEPGEEVVVQGSFVLKAQAERAHGGGEHDHH